MDNKIRDFVLKKMGKIVLVGIVLIVCSAVAVGQDRMATLEKSSVVYNGVPITQDADESTVLNKIISITVQDAPLMEAVKKIAVKTNLEMVYNSKLLAEKDRSITTRLEQVTVAEALWAVLEETDLRFAISADKQLVLLERKDVKNSLQRIPAATQETVSGTVTDGQSGEPLPAVNVSIKGTTIGTSTNAEGRYELTNVPSLQDTLIFSFVGFQTQEVPIEGRTVIDMQMVSQTVEGDELVVTGYGTQEKSTVTASISSVDLDDTPSLATQRVDQMLQGRASGLLIKNTDAAPGGNTEIRIRGMSSILGGNDALIVIDGLQGRDLSSVNPNDIESIEVLKDASATAIYGSEGANGVILIETKQGQSGAPQLNYRTEISTSQLENKMDLMNADDYARYINEIELANNVGRDPDPIFSESEVQNFEENGGTDWQDVVYRRAITHNHQLSYSGGTDEINYFVSGAYYDQEGILLNSGYERGNLRAKVNVDVSDWISIGLSWAGSKESDHTPLFGGQIDWPNNPVGGALQYPPTIPPYDEDGNYTEIPNDYGPSTLWNPLASAIEPIIDNNEFKNEINGFARFNFLEQLSLELNGGASLSRMNNLQYWNLNTFNGAQQGGEGQSYQSKNNYYQFQSILTYQEEIGMHSISATGVGELKYNDFFSSNIANSEFVNHDTGVYDLGGAEIQNTSSSYNERKIVSTLARVNYNYDSKYLLSASYRIDGSSVFGSENKWSDFPAGSIGWRVTEESFMEELEFISNIMLRVSWGKSGNQAINPYQTLAAISQTGNYPWDGGSSVNRGFRITRAANPLLRWEESKQTNFGIDIGLFEDRVTIETDYYNKTTDYLLMNRELPTSTGLSSIIDNVGSMENKGWEFSIEGREQIGAVNFTTGINFTKSKTTVLDLGETDELAFDAGGSGAGTVVPFMYLREGEEFGQMIGWGYEGTWDQDEAQQAAEYGQLPGDPQYTDVDNDGDIDMEDQKVIGNSLPDFIFGLTHNMNYRNFDLNFLIQGTVGNDIFNIARINREEGGTSARLLDRWTPENQDTDIPAIIDGQTREEAGLESSITFPSGASNQTSRWVEDGSYIRLKSMLLGYTLPSGIIEKFQLSNLRVHLSASNLLTITDYMGFDPEVSSFTGNDAQLGTDFNNYPPARTVTLGINISL